MSKCFDLEISNDANGQSLQESFSTDCRSQSVCLNALRVVSSDTLLKAPSYSISVQSNNFTLNVSCVFHKQTNKAQNNNEHNMRHFLEGETANKQTAF